MNVDHMIEYHSTQKMPSRLLLGCCGKLPQEIDYNDFPYMLINYNDLPIGIVDVPDY